MMGGFGGRGTARSRLCFVPCQGWTSCLSFPGWGCGAGCSPPPPNLRLKLSFPSFVLPAGVSLSSCPPASPSPPATGAHPSSVSSAKGGMAWPGGAQTCSPSSTYRYRSLAQPPAAATRLSSVSSHDSGFISQDAAYSKPPSPMPSDITSQVWGEGLGGGVSATTPSALCLSFPLL